MVKSKPFAVVSVVALAIVAGCGKEESTPTTPAAKPAPNAAKDLQSQGKSIADQATEQGKAAANAASSNVASMATQKLDEAARYVKENKVDLADKIVAQLESQRASYPANIQQRLADVRKMVDDAKAKVSEVPAANP